MGQGRLKLNARAEVLAGGIGKSDFLLLLGIRIIALCPTWSIRAPERNDEA
jgi:hypothetical protein